MNRGRGKWKHWFAWRVVAGGFHIHAEALDGRETLDPDCCLAKLEALLRERASWAHDPEQEGSEWRLVSREGRTLKREAERDAERATRDAEWGKTRARLDRWIELPKQQRVEMVRGLLGDGGLTAAEIAAQLEVTHPEIKVHAERIRPLVANLYKRGELDRESERYRAGDSVRYRYSLADGGQAR